MRDWLHTQNSLLRNSSWNHRLFDKTTMSYFWEANLVSLSCLCASCSCRRRSKSLTRSALPFLISEHVVLIWFSIWSQYWQVSILAFRKLNMSRKFRLKMFLKVEKLITGPLFFICDRFVLKSGFFATKSRHIFLMDTLESKYLFWVLALR